MLALVCPGQGSQAPGMLAGWLGLPGVADHLRAMSAVVGPVGSGGAAADLLGHGTASDADTLRDTAVAQPLIVAAGLASAAAVSPSGWAGLDVVVAGHSVGELTAAALAGALDPDDALVLVRERGRAMAAAAATTTTGMSAVVGGRPEEVEAAIAASGATAANRNAAGQVVAAGTLEQLAALAAGTPTSDPVLPLLSNADGAVVTSGADVLARIVTQVASPVRWDLCSEALAALGVTALLELAPAGTLAGLAKRALPGVEIVAVKGPDDLGAARDLLARHATSADGSRPT